MTRYQQLKLQRNNNSQNAIATGKRKYPQSESRYRELKKKRGNRVATSAKNSATEVGENLPAEATTLSQQVENARVQMGAAQDRLQFTQREYETFMNRQVNADQYDFLETGGVTPAQVQNERNVLWKNFTDAQAAANQATKTYNDLSEAYKAQIENAERDSYQAMEMDKLNALKENQKAVVEQNQSAAMKAQNDYGVYMNQWTNTDDLDFLEGNWGPSEEEKKKQQALLQSASAATDQLTASRESLHLMEDTYNYRYDTQLISEMSETERIALSLYSNGINVKENIRVINSLTSEQREQLRNSGKYWQILTDPKGYLKSRGYGNENLDRLAESFMRQYNAEQMEIVQNLAQSTEDALGIWSTIGTYPTKLLGDISGGLTSIGSGIEHTLGLSHYHGIDVNKPGYTFSVYTDSVRDAVSEDFTDSGKALYNGFNSLADEAVSDFVLGGLSDLAGLEHADDAIKMAHSMLGSYGEGVRNTAIDGGTTNEALGIGTANAAIDFLTSWISVDELLETRDFDAWSDVEKRLLNGGVNMTQEELNTIGKLVTQTAILAEDSEFDREVEALVQTGISEEEARTMVFKQYASELEYAAVLPFLNGFAE